MNVQSKFFQRPKLFSRQIRKTDQCPQPPWPGSYYLWHLHDTMFRTFKVSPPPAGFVYFKEYLGNKNGAPQGSLLCTQIKYLI